MSRIYYFNKYFYFVNIRMSWGEGSNGRYSKRMLEDVYRPAASMILLRPSGVCTPDVCSDVYQLLLLQKPRRRDAWQLPQGGVEAGETVEEAALRELKEETGIMEVNVIGKSTAVYQYDFPQSYRRFRPDNVRGQRIEYIFAPASQDCTVHVDEHEVIGHAWVDPTQLHLYLRRKEYLNFVRKLFFEALEHTKEHV